MQAFLLCAQFSMLSALYQNGCVRIMNSTIVISNSVCILALVSHTGIGIMLKRIYQSYGMYLLRYAYTETRNHMWL